PRARLLSRQLGLGPGDSTMRLVGCPDRWSMAASIHRCATGRSETSNVSPRAADDSTNGLLMTAASGDAITAGVLDLFRSRISSLIRSKTGSRRGLSNFWAPRGLT